MFYQVIPIDHYTHVPGLFDQSSSKSEYNEACTTGMDLEHSRMISNKLMKKDPEVVP